MTGARLQAVAESVAASSALLDEASLELDRAIALLSPDNKAGELSLKQQLEEALRAVGDLLMLLDMAGEDVAALQATEPLNSPRADAQDGGA